MSEPDYDALEWYKVAELDELAEGRIAPVVDAVLPLDQVADAHRRMQASEHFGKLVLSL